MQGMRAPLKGGSQVVRIAQLILPCLVELYPRCSSPTPRLGRPRARNGCARWTNDADAVASLRGHGGQVRSSEQSSWCFPLSDLFLVGAENDFSLDRVWFIFLKQHRQHDGGHGAASSAVHNGQLAATDTGGVGAER